MENNSNSDFHAAENLDKHPQGQGEGRMKENLFDDCQVKQLPVLAGSLVPSKTASFQPLTPQAGAVRDWLFLCLFRVRPELGVPDTETCNPRGMCWGGVEGDCGVHPWDPIVPATCESRAVMKIWGSWGIP